MSSIMKSSKKSICKKLLSVNNEMKLLQKKLEGEAKNYESLHQYDNAYHANLSNSIDWITGGIKQLVQNEGILQTDNDMLTEDLYSAKKRCATLNKALGSHKDEKKKLNCQLSLLYGKTKNLVVGIDDLDCQIRIKQQVLQKLQLGLYALTLVLLVAVLCAWWAC